MLNVRQFRSISNNAVKLLD